MQLAALHLGELHPPFLAPASLTRFLGAESLSATSQVAVLHHPSPPSDLCTLVLLAPTSQALFFFII